MQSAKAIINKLKSRYKVTSIWQLILILITFSLAGITLVLVRDFIQVFQKPDFGLKVVQFVCINMPVYYVLLIIYAIILGQMKFFRPFVNRSLGRVLVPFKLLYIKLK